MSLGSVFKEVENGAERVFGEIEKYFVKGMSDAEKLLPVAEVAVSLIPGCPLAVGEAIQAIPALMTSAEAAFPAKGNGPVKAAAVKGFVKGVCETAESLSSGGQANTWAKVEPICEKYIDGAVAVANGLKTVAAAATSAPATDGPSGPAMGTAIGE